jgi:hypothetical protein
MFSGNFSSMYCFNNIMISDKSLPNNGYKV